jgi:hypothetical protein
MHTDSGLSVLYWLTMRFPERVAPLLSDIIPAALALSRSERRDRDLAMCLRTSLPTRPHLHLSLSAHDT